MLKLRTRHRLQVPHGLAIVGALLLLVSTVTGFGTVLNLQQGEPTAAISAVANSELESTDAVERVDTVPQAPVKQKKRFRINLFLFRG